MITGETVILEKKGTAGVNSMNETVYGDPVLEGIDNVLVDPGATSDLTDSNRTGGSVTTMTLHFPKAYDSYSFKGLRVKVRGVWGEVVGDPSYYTEAATPGTWNYPVEVRFNNG